MGFEMAKRLLKSGCDLTVYNRTQSKAEPLRDLGAKIAASPADLSDRDIVFFMVSGPEDFKEVVLGSKGVLSKKGPLPKLLVDCSSISEKASLEVRAAAAELNVAMLAAPVSGNHRVVKAGRLSVVASGPPDAFAVAEPYLQMLGEGVSYVGEGERARVVKICHNVLLGVVSQCMAEITVVAEKSGVSRHAFLDFINKSVMGSTFTRYKTPAFVNLDFSTTFTPALLRKDMDLGLEAARKVDVPVPVTALVREIIQALVGSGYDDCDFAVLLEQTAKQANLKLVPENVKVPDGLGN
jgi:3-hydroxyisobutyrate dehydrogenase-like beta-hydroxyacid dehydrogenase